MSHALEGVCRLIQVDGTSVGAGATSVNLRPSQGCIWELLFAYGMQDDGAVAYGWYWTDPDVTNHQVIGGTAAAAYEKMGFPAMLSVTAEPYSAAPLVLTYDRYATFTFTASGAGKKGYIKAFVKEYRGVAYEA